MPRPGEQSEWIDRSTRLGPARPYADPGGARNRGPAGRASGAPPDRSPVRETLHPGGAALPLLGDCLPGTPAPVAGLTCGSPPGAHLGRGATGSGRARTRTQPRFQLRLQTYPNSSGRIRPIFPPVSPPRPLGCGSWAGFGGAGGCTELLSQSSFTPWGCQSPPEPPCRSRPALLPFSRETGPFSLGKLERPSSKPGRASLELRAGQASAHVYKGC